MSVSKSKLVKRDLFLVYVDISSTTEVSFMITCDKIHLVLLVIFTLILISAEYKLINKTGLFMYIENFYSTKDSLERRVIHKMYISFRHSLLFHLCTYIE